MAKTQDLKRRIRSIRNTRQLTNAMKMVSAAKLRRAQERMIRARPYAHRVLSILQSLASRAQAESHPLLAQRDGNRVEYVVIAGDKGLCGSFNATIIRTATEHISSSDDIDLTVSAVGKKSRDFFSHHGFNVRRAWTDQFRDLKYSLAEEIGRELMRRFIDGEVDRIYLVFNEFKSAIQSKPIVQQLLPIHAESMEADDSRDSRDDYIYEPGAGQLFAALLPHYVENQIFHATLESVAAEHAARMSAMDSATKNAGELIESLTLTMNRVRQSAITTEIIEVVSGAEALG